MNKLPQITDYGNSLISRYGEATMDSITAKIGHSKLDQMVRSRRQLERYIAKLEAVCRLHLCYPPTLREMPQREKCSYADKYKAIRKPTCGCKSCEQKWWQKQGKLARERL